MTYPILVAALDDARAVVMGCNDCGHRHSCPSPAAFAEAAEAGSCPACSSYEGYQPAFEPGVPCGGCGQIAPYQPVDGCCSAPVRPASRVRPRAHRPRLTPTSADHGASLLLAAPSAPAVEGGDAP